jgi:hypothetical protein
MLTREQIDNWSRWAIKVPFGNDELYVTENERVVTYDTKEEALEAAKIWNRYKVVLYTKETK